MLFNSIEFIFVFVPVVLAGLLLATQPEGASVPEITRQLPRLSTGQAIAALTSFSDQGPTR